MKIWAVACAADDWWTEESLAILRRSLPEAIIVSAGVPEYIINVRGEYSRQELEGALLAAKGRHAGLEIRGPGQSEDQPVPGVRSAGSQPATKED